MTKYDSSDKALKVSKRDLDKLVKEYISYLDTARTPSKVVTASVKYLENKGFAKYDFFSKNERSNKFFFIDRNNINLAAVVLGNNSINEGMNIAGAHVDFCTLTNKVVSAIEKSDGVYLDTRPYGGFYPHQWMDRPLVVFGKTLAKTSKDKRVPVEWQMPGHIPEPTIHNPQGYSEKSYKDAFQLENLDIFTGYKTIKDFLKALNKTVQKDSPKITKEDFNSGFTEFHAVPAEATQLLGNYIVGYGHDDRSCMFSAVKALTEIKNPKYTSIALGVSREEIGSVGVGGANDIFMDNVVKELRKLSAINAELSEIYSNSVMLSADVDIAFNPQNASVNDKENCAQFSKGASIGIANGSNGNPTGNVVMPNDLYFIEHFLNKRNLAYQVNALPSKVGIGGGGGTIARFYSEKGIMTADLGIPVGNMHGTVSRIYATDLDSTVEAFKALFLREKERQIWG